DGAGPRIDHCSRSGPREGSISRTTRILCALGGTVLVAALVAWYVVGYVITLPPTVPQASAAGVTNITVQTVASYGHAPHPDWVSYLVKDEQGNWVHSTIWKVPAHSVVRVTVLQYDGDSGLRRWQCVVPCAARWLYGFGGPMQTVGWMDGFLKVV